MNINIEEIIKPSIQQYGLTKFIYDNIEFTLKSSNFNYFCFLIRETIKSFIIIDNYAIILLDRYAIRHIYERFIIINLSNKKIYWCERRSDNLHIEYIDDNNKLEII